MSESSRDSEGLSFQNRHKEQDKVLDSAYLNGCE